jgi:hypothetical protein
MAKRQPTEAAQQLAEQQKQVRASAGDRATNRHHENGQRELAGERPSLGERVAEKLAGPASPELEQFTRESLKQHQQQDFERTQIREQGMER